MKSLCFWSRKTPGSSFSLAEKHSSGNILVRIPCRKFHASVLIKKASSYLFPVIERDFSEHWVLSWKANAVVLGTVRYWQMGVMLFMADSEGVQVLMATRKLCCEIQLPLLLAQTRGQEISEILHIPHKISFIPHSGLFFGTTVHTGISSMSHNCR